jgi:hypothetical protein
MDINSLQNPFIKNDEFPAINYHQQSFDEAILSTNNSLEDLMEKLEDFLSKAEQFPEVGVPAKELKIKAAQLRKTEPKDFNSKTTNDCYISVVNSFINEANVQWEELNKQFVNAKIAKIKCESFKEKGDLFLASLLKLKEEFAKVNYTPVVNYYQRNIDCFKNLMNSITPQNLDEYKTEWMKRYEKFIPNHEKLLKLKDTNSTMGFFIKLSEELLKNNISANDDQINFQNKIKTIAESPDVTLTPKQIEELREYIETTQTFFEGLEKYLET